MHYQTFSLPEQAEYPIAFLVPKLDEAVMVKEYLDPGLLKTEDVIGYTLHQTGKKTPVATMRSYLDDLLPVMSELNTQYLMVSDGDYFKTLTGVKKADSYLGYVLPNVYPEKMVGQFNVIYCPNYRQVFYNPGPVRAKILQATDALYSHRQGLYRDPGCQIIKFSAYPSTVTDIAAWLGKLLKMDCDLTCDIEGFSLKHYDAGVGTISFSWNKSEGIAFPVDLSSNGAEVRKLLINFFRSFERKMTYHHISYDVTVLIYQLFMKDLIDTEGLLDGLEVMLRNWDDTKLIAYLATNSCAGNKLGLKEQAQEYAGNYAVEDIKDITKIPLPELLEYNLVDTLSTWYVYEKHWDTLVADNQLRIYEDLFKPAIVDIIQMQLTGMPLDMDKVAYAKNALGVERADAIRRIQGQKVVTDFANIVNEEAETARYQDWVDRKSAGVKVRDYVPGTFNEPFNPNSGPQKVRLLYEILGLPILETTKNKAPATGHEVLEKLKAYTEDQNAIDLINAMLDYASVDKIYSTFIPAMENAQLASDGCYYLFGSFNLGGTVSGRLSSSEPNLQNLPAKGKWAKLIKDCFRAPKGWLFIGLDFDSLEDKISALTTKDPNKLKVYTDGYDGHSLRAFSYFSEKMVGIDESVASINSIADLYPDLRQDSKTPTFALTYQGTYITLMAKCGFSKIVAMQIESRYHDFYKVSDEWVAGELDKASCTGYVTAAFGLRVRTPLLHQVIRGNSSTPYEAEAEGRTAGNALGQSYCVLNSRAWIEFMAKVRAHPKFRTKVRPIAQIHDAGYALIPDDLDVFMYVNEHLVKAVQWQDDPAIAHPDVKLGGKLGIFHPSWATEITIPNGADAETILDIVAAKT